MQTRTDLAAEQAAQLGLPLPQGIRTGGWQKGGVAVQWVRVQSRTAAHLLGKPCGIYYTIEGRKFTHSVDDSQKQARAAAAVLARLLPPRGRVLVVGLGNRAVTPDAFGPRVADRVLATCHWPAGLRAARRLRSTAVVVPGVLPQTGLQAARQVGWAAKEFCPAAVVVVDALAAAESHRLGRTIQISDAGIVPGSGVGGGRRAICRATLGVPVIAVGVPMVIDAAAFAQEFLQQQGQPAEKLPPYAAEPLMVTPHNVDEAVRRSANCVATALNLALQPGLTPAELRAL